ncbi:MAG: TIR domain-containing protein [Hyphomicrobiales bacterium]|nr:TIR domain-containing protein [Hyphomicrobiales bacterium]
MSKIFISHSSADNIGAQALANWLSEQGWHEVFLDIDPDRGIKAAQRWERALHDAAQRCEAVIFLISRAWLNSPWCGNEYGLARALNKPMLGLIIDRNLSIDILRKERPDLAATWQMADLAGGTDGLIRRAVLPGGLEEGHVTWSQAGLRRLKAGLEQAGLDPKYFAWPPADEPDRSPYPGLQALEARDAGVFFGRDASLIAAGDKLRELWRASAPRLLLLLGTSGAGKSSFLRAGLLPRLARDDAHFLPLAPIRPEGAALYGDNGLLGALRLAFPQKSGPDLRAAIGAGAEGLRPLLKELVEARRRAMLAADDTRPPPAILMAIDQAEELLREPGLEESEALLALLRELSLRDDPALIVIFTLRADALDDMQRALGSSGQEPFLLPAMPKGNLRDVIEGPARRRAEAGQKLDIDPALTERLMADAEASGGGDTLPLIAFVLENLFRDHGGSGALKLGHYEASGGIGGAIDAAMARVMRKADARPDIPRDKDQRLVLLRRGLVPWLAGIDPATRLPRRAIALKSDIPPEATPLVELMIGERLLVEGRGRARDNEASAATPAAATLEPAHEALLRQWGMLKGWLDQDLGLLASLEGLREAARDWDANNKADSWLAHQGNRLDDALSLKGRTDLFDRLNDRDRAYLEACTAREQEARAKAQQAQDNELALARARAEEAQTRARNARRLALTAGAAVIVVALAGAGVWLQRNAAVKAQGQAEQALGKATKTANVIVFDLAQKYRNQKGVSVALLHQLLDPVIKMLDQLTATGAASTDMLAAKSSALATASGVLRRQGDDKGAAIDAQRALVIDQRLVKLAPYTRLYQFKLTGDYEHVGDIARHQGHLDAALLDYQQELAIDQLLVKLAPHKRLYQDSLADAYQWVGYIAEKQGHLDAALQNYQNYLAIEQRLVKLDPGNVGYKDGLAASFNKIGIIAEKQGRLDVALQDYQNFLAVMWRLARLDPGNLRYQDGLASAYQDVAIVAEKQGHLDAALQDFRQQLAINQRLVKLDPGKVGFQYGLASAYQFVGDIVEKQGHLNSALQDYQKFLAIGQSLVKLDPGNVGFQDGLASAYAHIAELYLDMSPPNKVEARKALTAGRAIIAPLAAAHPDDPDYRSHLQWIDANLAKAR